MFRIVYLLDSFFHARLKLTCISKTLCRQVSFYGFSTTTWVYIQAEKVRFGCLPIEAFRLHELLNDRTTQCNTRWIKETTFNKKQKIVLFIYKIKCTCNFDTAVLSYFACTSNTCGAHTECTSFASYCRPLSHCNQYSR